MEVTYYWNNHTTKETERFYHTGWPDEARPTSATFLLRDQKEADTILEVINTILGAECDCRKVTIVGRR